MNKEYLGRHTYKIIPSKMYVYIKYTQAAIYVYTKYTRTAIYSDPF